MIEYFLEPYKTASATQLILELIIFVTGLASVWLAKKVNILVYPIGLIATILSSYIMYTASYYADMSINIYYSIMSIYGWIYWAKNKQEDNLKITQTNTKEKLQGFALFLLSIGLFIFIYTLFDYDLKINNYIDILTSGVFFTAMWYMARKKIENWILWIIGDILLVPILFNRGLGILAVQYIIFTIFAFLGYKEWKKYLAKKI